MTSFADGAGEKSSFNPQTYGMGGITIERQIAWQMKRETFLNFLKTARDTQRTPDNICSEELLAQIFNIFVIKRVLGRFANRIGFELFGDNKPVQLWLKDTKAKHAFQASLIIVADILSINMNSLFIHSWCITDDMELSGADKLPRESVTKLYGCKVIKISRSMFQEFTSFYKSGTPPILQKMMQQACPNRFDKL